jgi:hypothetical protein
MAADNFALMSVHGLAENVDKSLIDATVSLLPSFQGVLSRDENLLWAGFPSTLAPKIKTLEKNKKIWILISKINI